MTAIRHPASTSKSVAAEIVAEGHVLLADMSIACRSSAEMKQRPDAGVLGSSGICQELLGSPDRARQRLKHAAI
jgi:hypothetical protein